MFDNIELDTQFKVDIARILMNRPASRNPTSIKTAAEVRKAFELIETEKDVRIDIATGTGFFLSTESVFDNRDFMNLFL